MATDLVDEMTENQNFSSTMNASTTKYVKNNYNKIQKEFDGKKTIIISISYPKNLDYRKLEDFVVSLEAENIIFISPHLVKPYDDKCKDSDSNFQICYSNKDEKNIANFKSKINLIKDSNQNIDIYDFTNFFCNLNICSNYLKKIDLYVFIDNFSHITKEFAEFISPDFKIFLKSIKSYN